MAPTELLGFYEQHLREQVLPFWEPLVDWQHGGLNNCVADDGTIISTDKFIWSQGRALWLVCSIYQRFDADPKWLAIADNIAAFMMANGRLDSGLWAFTLAQDGSVAAGHESIYADAFAIYGLGCYAQATGNSEALAAARDTYRLTLPLLADHSALPTRPHPIPRGLQSHGIWMIFAHCYHELALVAADPEIGRESLALALRVLADHVKVDDQLLYELVGAGGEIVPSDAGLTFVPGHAIESMWMLEQVFAHHRRAELTPLCLDVMRWHLEKGWDSEYGGLFLACHRDGGRPVWHQPDAKVWWPHTEALCALLRAGELSDADWIDAWYWRLHDYSFGLFPDLVNGDWHHYFSRRGEAIPVAVASLPVKDPFHLPRALLMGIESLRRRPDQDILNSVVNST